jgi:hypothetical protein
MAKHLVGTTGYLEACQKRSEDLAAIRWIQLKITGGSWRGSKTTVFETPYPLGLQEFASITRVNLPVHVIPAK